MEWEQTTSGFREMTAQQRKDGKIEKYKRRSETFPQATLTADDSVDPPHRGRSPIHSHSILHD